MFGFGRFFLMLALLTANAGAHACQCMDALEGGKRSSKDIQSERKRKATIVVRGNVVSVKAGADINWPSGGSFDPNSSIAAATGLSNYAVLTEFEVVENQKGKTGSLIQIYSGFGTGDCGFGAGLMSTIPMKRSLTLGLEPIASVPDAYTINACSYLDIQN